MAQTIRVTLDHAPGYVDLDMPHPNMLRCFGYRESSGWQYEWVQLISESEDESHYLMSNTLRISWYRQGPPPSEAGTTWDDEEGGHYSISVEQQPLPETKVLSNWQTNERLQRISSQKHYAAFWRLGPNILTVRLCPPDRTSEATTLNAINSHSFSFKAPEVLFHHRLGDYTYMVTTVLDGQELSHNWSTVGFQRQELILSQIAKAMTEISKWQTSNRFTGGIDGKLSSRRESWLMTFGQKDFGMVLTQKDILANIEKIGLDCSKPFFLHPMLHMENIIFNDHGLVGFRQWDRCSFLPAELLGATIWKSDQVSQELDGYYCRLNAALEREGIARAQGKINAWNKSKSDDEKKYWEQRNRMSKLGVRSYVI